MTSYIGTLSCLLETCRMRPILPLHDHLSKCSMWLFLQNSSLFLDLSLPLSPPLHPTLLLGQAVACQLSLRWWHPDWRRETWCVSAVEYRGSTLSPVRLPPLLLTQPSPGIFYTTTLSYPQPSSSCPFTPQNKNLSPKNGLKASMRPGPNPISTHHSPPTHCPQPHSPTAGCSFPPSHLCFRNRKALPLPFIQDPS